MAAPDRPRRSLLYMPAANARALEKAKSLSADGLIFDLEDAVAPEAKPGARAAAVEAVRSGAYGKREVMIRVNGLDTQWCAEDLKAVAASGADGVVVPKINSVDELMQIENLLAAAGAPGALAVWAMMETARGILAAAAIGQSGSRLAGFMVGTADLAKELGCAHPADRGPMVTALQHVVLAARANGLFVLDGVHVDLKDDAGLEAACIQGRDFGFDGKTLIHPNQIEVANRIFAPSEEAVAQARRLIDAHRDAQARGEGVTTLDGRLIEHLHVSQAEKLIARAEAIRALEAA